MEKLCRIVRIIAATGLVFSLGSAAVLADSLAVPDFQPNTPATAASVNDAFGAVENSVNDNDSRISANEAQINTNTTDIGTNILAIDGHDTSIADLQTGKRPAGRREVNINCGENPNALKEPPYSDHFNPHTTFFIFGSCNGPLYITSDGVRVVGVDENRAAKIVLPADATNPEDAAIFVDGGHDVRIENLTVDASAWSTQGPEAAGIYARNAFVRMIDVDVIGGQYAVNPFRGGIIRMEGEINITEFVNAGISAGEASVVTTRGQVNISSTLANGNYLSGAEAYRGGVVDFRGGVTISVPDHDQQNNFFPYAVDTGALSEMRVRDGGTVSITGHISVYRGGIFDMRAGSLNGRIEASGNSNVRLTNVTQGEALNSVGSGAVMIVSASTIDGVQLQNNATMNIFNSSEVTGEINMQRSSAMNMFQTTQTGPGIVIYQNSSAEISQSTIGIIELYKASTLNLYESSFAGGFLAEASTADIWNTTMTQQDLTVNHSFLYYNAPGPGNYLNGHAILNCAKIFTSIDANVTASGSVACP